MAERRFLAVYSIGHGDRMRVAKLGLAYQKALSASARSKPTPVLLSALGDFGVYQFLIEHGAKAPGEEFMNALRLAGFQFSDAVGGDRAFVVEITGQPFASDLKIAAALSFWRVE